MSCGVGLHEYYIPGTVLSTFMITSIYLMRELKLRRLIKLAQVPSLKVVDSSLDMSDAVLMLLTIIL